VPRQFVQDSGGWRRRRFQQQIVTFDFEVNTGGASRPQRLACAHNRPLQRGVAFWGSDEIIPSPGISVKTFPSFPSLPNYASGDPGVEKIPLQHGGITQHYRLCELNKAEIRD
jgi:hypothetical protein